MSKKNIFCSKYRKKMDIIFTEYQSYYVSRLCNIKITLFQDRLYLLNYKIIRFPYDWGDCDLSHEGNTAIMTDKDTFMQFSVENVFPGISSNLNQSVCVKYFDESLQNIYENSDLFKSSPYRILSVYKHQVGSNIFQVYQ